MFGGGLGWTLGGPIGAFLGYALGGMFHDLMKGEGAEDAKGRANPGGRTGPSDFQVALLLLSARVIKADGQVVQSELDYVRKQFVQMFGKERANQSFALFREIVKKDVPLYTVCQQINRHTTHATRLQLVHYLFKLGLADGHLHRFEEEEIHRIAKNLRISEADWMSIRAMFRKNTDANWAFKVLEVPTTATESEVKKAYRKMAMKYHPDRLGDVGPDAANAAKEKFQEVQKAYDHICTQKGWS